MNRVIFNKVTGFFNVPLVTPISKSPINPHYPLICHPLIYIVNCIWGEVAPNNGQHHWIVFIVNIMLFQLPRCWFVLIYAGNRLYPEYPQTASHDCVLVLYSRLSQTHASSPSLRSSLLQVPRDSVSWFPTFSSF